MMPVLGTTAYTHFRGFNAPIKCLCTDLYPTVYMPTNCPPRFGTPDSAVHTALTVPTEAAEAASCTAGELTARIVLVLSRHPYTAAFESACAHITDLILEEVRRRGIYPCPWPPARTMLIVVVVFVHCCCICWYADAPAHKMTVCRANL